MRFEAGLRAFADGYDGFVVDLWGVVHDGVQALPGSVSCLQALRRQGKRVVLLSNAPRRAAAAARQLVGMGIGPELYDGLVTSGEVTRGILAERPHGERMFVIGPERDRNLFADLGLTEVATIEDADFVLNTGPNDEAPEAIEAFWPVLRRGAALGVPMVCANPDLEVIRGGVRVVCAGALALFYVGQGGTCRMIGKPHAEVYGPAFAALGVDKPRCVAVGDALATDMAGAQAAGIDGIWVLGGIHSGLLGRPDEALAAVDLALTRRPVGALDGFVW